MKPRKPLSDAQRRALHAWAVERMLVARERRRLLARLDTLTATGKRLGTAQAMANRLGVKLTIVQWHERKLSESEGD